MSDEKKKKKEEKRERERKKILFRRELAARVIQLATINLVTKKMGES